MLLCRGTYLLSLPLRLTDKAAKGEYKDIKEFEDEVEDRFQAAAYEYDKYTLHGRVARDISYEFGGILERHSFEEEWNAEMQRHQLVIAKMEEDMKIKLKQLAEWLADPPEDLRNKLDSLKKRKRNESSRVLLCTRTGRIE